MLGEKTKTNKHLQNSARGENDLTSKSECDCGIRLKINIVSQTFYEVLGGSQFGFCF